jgi:hypothetical protein
VAAVVGATALVSPGPEVAIGATVAVALVWFPSAGPERDAALALLLLGVIALSAVRRLREELPHLTFGAVWPLALGLQALLRSEDLLALDRHSWVVFLFLPTLVAATVVALTRRYGPVPALIAGASTAALGPGWGGAAGATLTALAAGGILGALPAPRAWKVVTPILVVLLLGAGGLGWASSALPGVEGELTASLALALLAGLALAIPRPWALWLLAGGLAVGSLGLPSLRESAPAWALVSWLPLLLPALVLPNLGGEKRVRDGSESFSWTTRFSRAAVAMALAWVGARWAPGHGLAPALAPALAMGALAVPRTGPVQALQGSWTATCLGLATLLAAYPWLRPDALPEALEHLGLVPGWGSAAAVIILMLTAALALRGGSASRQWAIPSFTVVAGLVGLSLLARVPGTPPTLLLGIEPVRLGEARPSWSSGLPGGTVALRALAVDSNLEHSADLAPGTPLARIRLLQNDEVAAEWQLLNGRDSGEWAARRLDVQDRSGLTAPPAWVSQARLPEDGPAFFAQRYRGLWTLPAAVTADRVEIHLAPELPATTALYLYRLELRP